MNYLKEINAFERYVEANFLPPAAQLMWYKLIALFNRCGWPDWVTLDNIRLMTLCGMRQEKTCIKTRDFLILHGMIRYRRGRKGFPSRYGLVPSEGWGVPREKGEEAGRERSEGGSEGRKTERGRSEGGPEGRKTGECPGGGGRGLHPKQRWPSNASKRPWKLGRRPGLHRGPWKRIAGCAAPRGPADGMWRGPVDGMRRGVPGPGEWRDAG